MREPPSSFQLELEVKCWGGGLTGTECAGGAEVEFEGEPAGEAVFPVSNQRGRQTLTVVGRDGEGTRGIAFIAVNACVPMIYEKACKA